MMLQNKAFESSSCGKKRHYVCQTLKGNKGKSQCYMICKFNKKMVFIYIYLYTWNCFIGLGKYFKKRYRTCTSLYGNVSDSINDAKTSCNGDQGCKYIVAKKDSSQKIKYSRCRGKLQHSETDMVLLKGNFEYIFNLMGH